MIPRPAIKLFLLFFYVWFFIQQAHTATGRFRIMWRDDPATTMVIGWDQFSGGNPVLFFDTQKHDRNPGRYAFRKTPDRVHRSKGMNSHFVRLTGLQPNTVYYFVVQDSEGVSACFSFQTMPDQPDTRLSIIAGGDSRNHREARRSANKLVGKLRPHFVIFAGDFTDNDSANEWQMWLDDWQHTIGSDGRLFPIVTALGNHELSSQSLLDVFDLHAPDAYYDLHFGGSLISIFTLNSKIPVGEQNLWLERKLQQHLNSRWKMAQYHHNIRPHTQRKAPREDLMPWARLFHKYNVQLALESDAHVVKWTYPIKPHNGPGSDRGFIQDDEQGTVYIGEGCWGAPLRDNDQQYAWTRSSGKFNQFKWIFVDPSRIEIRTVMTDGSDQVGEVDPRNIFEPPIGLSLWRPAEGPVVVIKRRNIPLANETAIVSRAITVEVVRINATPGEEGVLLEWTTKQEPSILDFQVERTVGEGGQFTLISSAKGSHPKGGSYRFLDPNPPGGLVRYRIKCMVPEQTPVILETACKVAKRTAPSLEAPPSLSKIMPSATGELTFEYDLPQPTSVSFLLVHPQSRNVLLTSRPEMMKAGTHIGRLEIGDLNKGIYMLIIKGPKDLIKRYEVIVR